MGVHRIKPVIKDYLWGGTKLIKKYHKETDKTIAAESWEISSHPDGESFLIDENMTLNQYIQNKGSSVLGTKGQKFEDFPILVKFIDAKDVLSIQVHPDDAYALEYENQYGKNEVWYILEAEPNSTIYYGVKNDISKETFEQAISNNDILSVLNKVEVKPKDVIYVEAGTIHAIGKGIVLCEIQQNSNVTYRVYDFDRKDSDGNTRELHIKQALEVSDLTEKSVDFSPRGDTIVGEGFKKQDLIKTQYFEVEHYEVIDKLSLFVGPESFKAIVCLKGSLEVNNLAIHKGSSLFIDADSKEIDINGKGEFLLIGV